MPHIHIHYPLIFLILGLLLLLCGRYLFWLFVAAAGFVAGVSLAPYILPHQGELFTLLVAAALGIGGALLAIFVQKIAVALGGFAVGAYLAFELCAPMFSGGFSAGGMKIPAEWLCFLIGGIIGAVLMMAFFNWALIILSSLYGAHLIVRGLPLIRGLPPLRHHYEPMLSVILAVIGIVFQALTYGRRSSSKT